MPQIKRLLGRCLFALGILVIQASQFSIAQELSFEIGTGLMAFDYVEYDDNNLFLDGESGLIPGVIVKLKTNKRVYYEWEGSVYYNKIEYDGQTQGGTPVVTDSDALIIDTHFKIGRNFSPLYEREQKVYVGMGYRYWWRNIRSGQDITGNPVAGIAEEYRWFYALAGYAAHFDVSNNVKFGIDLRLTKMFDAKLDVDFLGFSNFDNTSVNLGNKVGARFALPIEIKMTQSSITVAPFYEIIDIGRSNDVLVTSGGVATTTSIHEPRSETRNVGVEVTWLW